MSSRSALIMPLVLICVALGEDIVTYKVREHVHDPQRRALIILALTGVGFAIAAEWIGPFLRKVISTARGSSRSVLGTLGIWAFYVAAYGACYYAYLLIERHGIARILPASVR